jgi:LPS export ABC transporter protein LptC
MTQFKARNLLLFLALLLAAGLAVTVALRYRPVVEIAEVVKALPEGVNLALQDIDYTHSEGGVARWRLVARQVEHRAAEKFTAVSEPHLTFFAADGTEQGTLKARTGKVNADFSVVDAQGEVEVVSHDGYTLQTDHLTYRQQDRTISTDAPVRLVSAKLRLDGVGLDMNLDTQRLRIPARVRALVQANQTERETP